LSSLSSAGVAGRSLPSTGVLAKFRPCMKVCPLSSTAGAQLVTVFSFCSCSRFSAASFRSSALASRSCRSFSARSALALSDHAPPNACSPWPIPCSSPQSIRLLPQVVLALPAQEILAELHLLHRELLDSVPFAVRY